MVTRIHRNHSFVSTPRTPAESEVFTVLTVSRSGVAVYLRTAHNGMVELRDSKQVGILMDLVTAAYNRMLEIEQVEAQRGSDGGADALAVGVTASGAVPDLGRVL